MNAQSIKSMTPHMANQAKRIHPNESTAASTFATVSARIRLYSASEHLPCKIFRPNWAEADSARRHAKYSVDLAILDDRPCEKYGNVEAGHGG